MSVNPEWQHSANVDFTVFKKYWLTLILYLNVF